MIQFGTPKKLVCSDEYLVREMKLDNKVSYVYRFETLEEYLKVIKDNKELEDR